MHINILILDSDPFQTIYKNINWDACNVSQVRCTSNLKDAISLFQTYHPNLVIGDISFSIKDHVCLLDFLHQKINHKQKKYIIVYDENNSCFVKCSDFCQGAFATVKKPVDPAKLQFIIQSAVAQIIRFEKNKGVTVPLFDLLDLPISEIARKMILITYRRCGESFNLKILANELQKNPNYLSQLFLKETKLRFSEFLFACRMEKASEMIKDSDEKISYIAKMSGYSQLNHFHADFRLYFGCSPSELSKKPVSL